MFKLLTILFIISTSLFSLGFEKEITQAELQEKIEKKFPHEKTKLFAKFVLSNPKIDLKDGVSNIFIKIDVEVIAELLKIQESFIVEANGAIFYEAKTTDIFIKNAEVTKIENKNPNSQFNIEQIPDIKKTLSSLLNKQLSKKPIYNLKDSKNTTVSMASSFLQEIKVKDKKIILVIGL